MEHFAFTLGSFRCCSVMDADAVYGADRIFADAPRAELEPLQHPYSVEIATGGDRLLYLSDTVPHSLLLERPDWHSVYDMDRAEADATLRRLADRAADERMLVHAFHFPFPSLGHIERGGVGWRWRPLAEAQGGVASAARQAGN